MDDTYKSLILEKCWFSLYWFSYLKLPVLIEKEWSKECVLFCGLDPAILDYSKKISTWACDAEKKFHSEVKYNSQYRNFLQDRQNSGTTKEIKSRYESKVRRKSVAEVLILLKSQTSEIVARDFENWIRVHYFLSEFRNALRAWWLVLIRLRTFKGTSISQREHWERKKVLPPACLGEISSKIEYIFRKSEIVDKMKRNAPRVLAEPWETDVRDYRCMESLWLARSTESTVRFNALKLIANSCTDDEIQSVVDWAKIQASQLRHPDSQDLQGAKYICKTLPRFEGVSVFDISEEELNNYSANYP